MVANLSVWAAVSFNSLELSPYYQFLLLNFFISRYQESGDIEFLNAHSDPTANFC